MFFSPAALAGRADVPALDEVHDCLDALKEDPRCDGKLGMIGMCLTGGFVLQMARRTDLAAPVVFHHSFGVRGAGIPEQDAADVKHTVLGHFGELDRVVSPKSRALALKQVLGDRLDARFYDNVGHGLRSTFRYTPEAQAAWDATLDFFASHLR
jgi:carboxymethylenebutenolidase